MFHQIEITTKCNFRCFYCAGRDMRQRHMGEAVFQNILGRLNPGRHYVSLQGEGEPTLHPHFWNWVRDVSKAGYIPFTITNGSLIDPELAHRHFPTLGISLDTVDAGEAERIGRRNLDQILERVDRLIESMGAHRVIVYSVDYGQNLAPLKSFLRGRGVRRQLIQQLQRKSDYARRYAELHSPRIDERKTSQPCRYLTWPRMRFFNVDGIEFPCCFIKDSADYQGAHDLRLRFAAGQIPHVCSGCAEILEAT